MIDAYVKTVNGFKRRWIQHRDDGVIGMRRRINHPQSVVIHVEVDQVVLGRVEIVRAVRCGEVELFHACELIATIINSLI